MCKKQKSNYWIISIQHTTTTLLPPKKRKKKIKGTLLKHISGENMLDIYTGVDGVMC